MKITHMSRSAAVIVAAILAASACAPVPVAPSAGCAACPPCPTCAVAPQPPQIARFDPTGYDDLPGWRGAAHHAALRAFTEGCPRLRAPPALVSACEEARRVPATDGDARRFFERVFRPYAVSAPDGEREGLMTGYYEPVLPGRRTKDGDFVHPVYGVPRDLVTVDFGDLHPDLKRRRLRGRLEGQRLVPYPARGDIDAGAGLPAPVLAWVRDAVGLFFLHVQGSGQIDLGDGTRLRIGYADQNGHPYRSLGRYLVERGELTLDQASMQGIRAWAMAAHPAQLAQALASNPSYVFFRTLTHAGGPIGALGVPLTAGVSLAVDRQHIPLGAPVYLVTQHPADASPLKGLMVAQDTGGAIRGAVRGDVFWGSGDQAGEHAGRMRHPGRFWLLWPRGAEPGGTSARASPGSR